MCRIWPLCPGGDGFWSTLEHTRPARGEESHCWDRQALPKACQLLPEVAQRGQGNPCPWPSGGARLEEHLCSCRAQQRCEAGQGRQLLQEWCHRIVMEQHCCLLVGSRGCLGANTLRLSCETSHRAERQNRNLLHQWEASVRLFPLHPQHCSFPFCSAKCQICFHEFVSPLTIFHLCAGVLSSAVLQPLVICWAAVWAGLLWPSHASEQSPGWSSELEL